MRGGPWTAPLGTPSDLNPPSALPEWAMVMGGSWGSRPPYCSGAPPRADPGLGPRAAPARWCGLARRRQPPREHVAWGRWGARCAGPATSPPPASRSLLGEGGRPLGSGGGGGSALLRPSSRGGSGGGGMGGSLCRPPPRRVSACHLLSLARAGSAGSGQGGACGRFTGGACRGRGAPTARVQRPLRGGVRGRCLFSLPPSALRPEGEGAGRGGGSLVPWRRPLTAAGGQPGGSGPGSQPSAGGSHSSPAPLYLARAKPSCRPSLGSPAPSAVAARRWPAGGGREGQPSAVSGLQGKWAPPGARCLRPPSHGRWRALLRHTVSWGGRGSGGPAPPGAASHGTVPPPLSRVHRLGRHLRRRLCGGWGCGGGGSRRRWRQ